MLLWWRLRGVMGHTAGVSAEPGLRLLLVKVAGAIYPFPFH
jgi:hypothetical protein